MDYNPNPPPPSQIGKCVWQVVVCNSNKFNGEEGQNGGQNKSPSQLNNNSPVVCVENRCVCVVMQVGNRKEKGGRRVVAGGVGGKWTQAMVRELGSPNNARMQVVGG